MKSPLEFDRQSAFYGPLGEFVSRSEEGFEVDPLTILVQLLTAFGTLIGRRVSTTGNGPIHFPNLFTLVIGRTGVGKGCAWAAVEAFCRRIEASFPRLVHGHPESAPGLISLISDGAGPDYTGRAFLPRPVPDKRCLLVCEEMQAIVTAKSRQGSSLSEMLKTAWDGKDLENNTKQPIRATNPHVSLIGHITPEEFQDTLPRIRTDRSNGFTNRFLVVQATRVRSLPFGGPPVECTDLCDRLSGHLAALGSTDYTAEPRSIDFADLTRPLWEQFYMLCQDGDDFFDGLEGFVERLPPIAKRIAMIYAVADGAEAIGWEHLNAGIAVCLSCLDSARDVVPPCHRKHAEESLEQRIRDGMRDQSGWFSMTQIWDLLGRRGNTFEVHAAVDSIIAGGEWEAREEKADNNKTTLRYKVAELPSRITLSADGTFEHVTAQDLDRWRTVYPGINVAQEIKKAGLWLHTHPDRLRKHSKNLLGFITSWLGRSKPYYGVGNDRFPGNSQGGNPPTDPALRKYWHGDAHCRLTDAEYEAWKREHRPTKVTSAAAPVGPTDNKRICEHQRSVTESRGPAAPPPAADRLPTDSGGESTHATSLSPPRGRPRGRRVSASEDTKAAALKACADFEASQ